MGSSPGDKIFRIVFANPGISQNEIWRKAKNIHGKATFETNLKSLVKNKYVIEKNDPTHSQRKQFFVNGDASEILSVVIKKLDQIDDDYEKHYSAVYAILETYSATDSPKITKGIIDVFSVLIDDILDISNASLVYNLMGSKMFHCKSEQMRTKHVKKLKFLLKILRKKNPSTFRNLIAYAVYKLDVPF